MPRNLDESFEQIRDRVSRAAFRYFDPQGINETQDRADVYVENVFEDAVILWDNVTESFFEVNFQITENDVMFGQPRKVAMAYVEKSRSEKEEKDVRKMFASKGAELTGPIVKKDAARRIAYAPVLVPGEFDSDGEMVTKEKIEQSAHEWMAAYRNVDYQHGLNNVAQPVESFILPQDMTVEQYGEEQVIPEGSWILASKFSENVWGQIESGELTGYSVMGVRRNTVDSAFKSAEDLGAASKRTLLRDLGDDWVPTHVSIVDEPAVPKAKFFAFKSKTKSTKSEPPDPQETETSAAGVEIDDQNKDENLLETSAKKMLDKVRGFVNMPNLSKKAGRTLSQQNESRLQAAIEEINQVLAMANGESEEEDQNHSAVFSVEKEGDDMDEKAIKELIVETVNEAMKAQGNTETETGEKETGTEVEGEETEKPGTKSEEPEKEESENEESEAVKELKGRIGELENSLKRRNAMGVSSKAAEGQDDGTNVGDDTPKDFGGRDSYGRKRKQK